MHRTFIKLSDHEHKFLRELQSVIRNQVGKQVTLSNVVSGIIRDYRQVLEEGADPDFLKAYRKTRRRRRT